MGAGTEIEWARQAGTIGLAIIVVVGRERRGPFAFLYERIKIFDSTFVPKLCENRDVKTGGGKFLIRSVFFRLALVGVAIYLAVCVGCASWQRHMIFVPRHYTAEQMDAAAREAGLERWRNATGEAIGMKRLSPTQPARGTLLILYGNASWTTGCAHYVNDIQKVAPFDVYLLEYPGYADRPGTPSEAVVFRAADEAFQLLQTNQPVYLLGESLGSGVAAQVAGTFTNKVAGLILLSPYNRLTGVAQERVRYLPAWLLLVDRFPSEVYLRQYHGPVGVSVDGQDHVVQEKFGIRLYDEYQGPKRLWNFPDGRHIQIGEPAEQFWREATDFWMTNAVALK